jgi:hypothetical protein
VCVIETYFEKLISKFIPFASGIPHKQNALEFEMLGNGEESIDQEDSKSKAPHLQYKISPPKN